MKKLVLALLITVALIIFGLYQFYPAQLSFTQTTLNDVSDANASRFLIRKKSWQKWWPGEKNAADSNLFTYHGATYQLLQSTNSGISLLITKGSAKLKSKITFVAVDNLKVKVTWDTNLDGSKIIFTRINQYDKAKKVNADIAVILNHLKAFFKDERNVYGFDIHLNKIKDNFMITTSEVVTSYPDMAHIGSMIKRLKQIIKDENGAATNYPMTNVTRINKTSYEVTVAIPIKNKIKAAKNTIINNLVVGGYVLETDVKGGPNTINRAFNEVQNFKHDYKLTAPAMPFESLVTDRAVEKDTSKWVTKIFCPIF